MGLLALIAVAAAAEVPVVVSAGPEDVAVTIYNDDLALVRETRTVRLPEGEAVLEFRRVSDAIVPDAAIIEGLDGVFERNFDYDVLTPYALVSKSVGRDVTLVRTNPGTGSQSRERARVVSGGRGVVLDFGNGRVEAVECSGLPEGLAFDALPSGLRTTPTLSTRVHNKRTGDQTLTLVYLAHGISWEADYNVVIAPGGDVFDVEAWLTLGNHGETSFVNAKTAVVAGSLNREWEGREFFPRQAMADNCWAWGRRWPSSVQPAPIPTRRRQETSIQDVAASVSGIDEIIVTAMKREEAIEAQREDLLDYHFYRIPWRTNVAAKQSKQVRFMGKQGVRSEWLYRVDSGVDLYASPEPRRAAIVLRFENEKENRLGEPLPRGMFHVSQVTNDGEVLRLGGDWISDSAVGIPVEVEVGDAPTVLTRFRMTDHSEEIQILRSLIRGEAVLRVSARLEHVITNGRSTPVAVEVRDYSSPVERRISGASHPWEMDRGYPTFHVEIPPHSSVDLHYRVRFSEIYDNE
jgi:hypothetical protein